MVITSSKSSTSFNFCLLLRSASATAGAGEFVNELDARGRGALLFTMRGGLKSSRRFIVGLSFPHCEKLTCSVEGCSFIQTAWAKTLKFVHRPQKKGDVIELFAPDELTMRAVLRDGLQH
jgi:hypothetical protein